MLAPRVTWHPYQAERRLTPADEFVVLGCDGVFDVLDDQTVVDIGREALDAGKTPAVAARQIMNASLKRGSTDNISVVVLQFGSQVTGAAWAPFRAFEQASEGDFGAMDRDGGGFITLKEFFGWVEAREAGASGGPSVGSRPRVKPTRPRQAYAVRDGWLMCDGDGAPPPMADQA